MMTSAAPVASLAMYPFAAVRAATDELWSAVRARLDWGPESLEWTVLTPDVWHHPQLLVAQACGWPLVTELADSVAVVGTFDYDVPGAEHGRYRSVLVARDAATLDELRAQPKVVAAVNSPDSLSGWISLQHAWGGKPPVLETGAHVESARAVAEGRADLASIDAVTWALLETIEPELTRQLHVIGHGPLVPCLPLVTGWRNTQRVPALRAAFAAAVAAPELQPALARLRIRGFVDMRLADYLPLRTVLG